MANPSYLFYLMEESKHIMLCLVDGPTTRIQDHANRDVGGGDNVGGGNEMDGGDNVSGGNEVDGVILWVARMIGGRENSV